jgi:hypothetical protein
MPPGVDNHHPSTGYQAGKQVVFIGLHGPVADYLGIRLFSTFDRIVNDYSVSTITRDAGHDSTGNVL